MAPSISPFLISLTAIFLTFSTSASDSNFPASTISAAPSSLSSSPPPALSPDISPLFPTTPQLSPTESLPIIPSNPSPPKPDDDDTMIAQGPVMAVAPSRFMPDSSSLRLVSGGGCLSSVVVSGLVAFVLLLLSG